MATKSPNDALSSHPITFLQSHLKTLRQEHDKVLSSLKLKKLNYKKEFRKYNSLIKDILTDEENTDKIRNKIAKNEYKQKIFFSNFTKQFYLNFCDAFKDQMSQENIQLFLSFVQLQNLCPKLFLIISKDKNELENLLSRTFQLQNELKKRDEPRYTELRNRFLALDITTLPYPFNQLFESIQLNYNTVELRFKLKSQKELLEVKEKEKDATFLFLKNLEVEIIKLSKISRELVGKIRGASSLVERCNDMQESEVCSLLNHLMTEYNEGTELNNELNDEISFSMRSEFSVETEASIRRGEYIKISHCFTNRRDNKRNKSCINRGCLDKTSIDNSSATQNYPNHSRVKTSLSLKATPEKIQNVKMIKKNSLSKKGKVCDIFTTNKKDPDQKKEINEPKENEEEYNSVCEEMVEKMSGNDIAQIKIKRHQRFISKEQHSQRTLQIETQVKSCGCCVSCI